MATLLQHLPLDGILSRTFLLLLSYTGTEYYSICAQYVLVGCAPLEKQTTPPPSLGLTRKGKKVELRIPLTISLAGL